MIYIRLSMKLINEKIVQGKLYHINLNNSFKEERTMIRAVLEVNKMLTCHLLNSNIKNS